MKVFIGYDPREHEAYEVCAHSIRSRSSAEVVKLDAAELRNVGLYDRPYRVDETGQMWDERDKRPFSTAFAFTRFLVPLLTQEPALFVDCDFLFQRDVRELFNLFDPTYAVQVVKHNHVPTATMKMDGISQGLYARKNWSSCMLFNPQHHAHGALSAAAVNTWPGRDLHAFKWLADCYIGTLPEAWNWLTDDSPTCGGDEEDIAALHYTNGGPWFAHMQDARLAEVWRAEQRAMFHVKSKAA